MRRDSAEIDERFAAYVRDRGDHHLRVALLLTGDWHAAEDLPEAHVGELLGCSPGTVKTHAHRGLRTLRDLLGGDFELRAVNQTVNQPRASQRDDG
jgi:DNA-directed RNA polymerase specialized sigma24 family protein